MVSQGEKASKVAVLGLDGATFDLIRPWAEEGKLPTLAQFMRDGAWGELAVQLPPNTVPNWPSYMTGTNPGKHGIVWWLRHRHSWQDMELVDSRLIQQPTIWDLAGQAGKRSIVVNVPVTYPPRTINGVMITDGILTPPGTESFTFPASLSQEIAQKVGEYCLWPAKGYSARNPQPYLDKLHQVLEGRFKTLRYLLRACDWDFLSAVFSATDWVSHAYWRYTDPQHPLYDAKMAERFGDAILGVYQHVDRILGQLLDELGSETMVLVMSDHGFGPLYGLSHLNNWLLQEGYLVLKGTALTRLRAFLHQVEVTMEMAYKIILALGLMGLKKRINPKLHGRSLAKALFLSFDDVDWQRTQAVAFGAMGQIYINLPEASAAEYSRLRAELAARLQEIRLPGSDEPYVGEVLFREEVYSGQMLDILPDLLVIPRSMKYLDAGLEFFTNKLFSGALGGTSGTHRRHGIFIAYGPLARRGKELKDLNILDLAPTALYLMGLPVPTHMDGRVLVEALREGLTEGRPIERIDLDVGQGDAPGSSEGLSEQEEQKTIMERLRSLGYIE